MFEPRAIISVAALRDAGELQPGQLFRTAYRLLLKPEAATTFEDDLNARWESEGLRYRGPEDAVDGLRSLLDMLNTFMTVIGIAALVAGGVGVAQATSSFLESRVDSIAVLKALGADAGTIRAAIFSPAISRTRRLHSRLGPVDGFTRATWSGAMPRATFTLSTARKMSFAVAARIFPRSRSKAF
jgi:predicted lysophospholipase L1 biosynthesis ABC-type transport system permease subunit